MATLVDFPQPRRVRILKRLNVRTEPTTAAPRVDRLEPGAKLEVDALEQGESILGIDSWYRSRAGHYFWSGPTQLEELPPVSAALDLPRRADGSIAPLADPGSVFGRFNYAAGKQGYITINDATWLQNLEDFDHPVLDKLGIPKIKIHKRAEPYFDAVFNEIRAQQLDDCILTFDGCFVPRYKNWDPAANQLSSHSWGIAIDLNARFNPARQQPALPGERGCLRELVPIFNAAGFAWGGHFSKPVDGMHFELALRSP